MTKFAKFNFLFITGIALFLLAWWAVMHFFVYFENTQARIFWSVSMVVQLFIGAYFGFVLWLRNETGKMRAPLLLIGIGVFLQGVGGVIFSAYEYALNVQYIFPSPADIFYVISYILYLVATILIIKCFLPRERRIGFAIWALILTIIIIWADLKIFSAANFKIAADATTLTIFGYVIFQSIYTVLAISLAIVTNFFRGVIFRVGLCFVVLGLILQFLVDLNFVFTSLNGSWAYGDLGDVMYVFPYYAMSAALILFLNVAVTVPILVIVINSFLMLQLVFSYHSDRFINDAVLLLLSFCVSFVLVHRNKSDTKNSEARVRLHALEESNKKLTELDHQKTEFLTIAAHQLRTPVSIINNYIGMLQDGDYGHVADEAKKVLSNMDQSNQWLVRLADEFLNIANLEQGQTKFHFSKINIVQLINKVILEVEPKAKDAGLVIKFTPPAEPMFAEVDEEKIKHVLLNLMDNAVKYGKIEGDEKVRDVTITVKEGVDNGGKKGVIFSVKDSGIGFDKDDEQRFFQKFSRGKNAKGMHVNLSTGLGLYIVRKFVEGHGGAVWAKSEGPGQGSEFGVWVLTSKK